MGRSRGATGTSTAGKDAIIRVERRKRIVDLVLKGFTYDQIAAIIAKDEGKAKPISRQGIHFQLKESMAERREELNQSVDELRHIQRMRIQLLINRLFVSALPNPAPGDKTVPEPKLDHVNALQRSIDQLSKLEGLNAADKVALEVTREAEEMIRLLAGIAKRFIPTERLNEFNVEVMKAFDFASKAKASDG